MSSPLDADMLQSGTVHRLGLPDAYGKREATGAVETPCRLTVGGPNPEVLVQTAAGEQVSIKAMIFLPADVPVEAGDGFTLEGDTVEWRVLRVHKPTDPEGNVDHQRCDLG
jgi:plastocyanin